VKNIKEKARDFNQRPDNVTLTFNAMVEKYQYNIEVLL
jgi:hypothetical protein